MLDHTLELMALQLTAARWAQRLRARRERSLRAITGAWGLLACLRIGGIRSALICDTGCTPDRVL